MAFTPNEKKNIKDSISFFIESKRPPLHIRDQLDISYRIENQSVIIFEVRPAWDNPNETMYGMVAKAKYVRTQDLWKVFWQRADLKWHVYDPHPEVSGLAEFYTLLQRDDHHCFWG